MKRREPQMSAVGEMPERLRRFELDEWIRYVPREPPGWNDGTLAAEDWQWLKARLMWSAARTDWQAACGEGWWGQKPEGRARAVADLAEVGIELPDGAAA